MPTSFVARCSFYCLLNLSTFLEHGSHLLRNLIGGETEARIHVGELSRCAEPIHADHAALHAYVPPPGQCSASLDCQSRSNGGRQEAVTIRLVLRIESLGGGHRDQADPPPRCIELLDRLGGDTNL